MRRALMIVAALLGALMASPASADDALRSQIARQRTAHLTYDAEMLVGLFSADFTLIDNGVVSRPTREESRARFQLYFDGVRFRAWDDVDPPRITLSPDGRMATVVVTKLVRLVDRANAGNADADIQETRFAWLEIWRLEPAGWRLIQLASTRQPASAR